MPPGPVSDMQSYAQFWPYYLSRHSRRAVRRLHIASTLGALLAVILGIATFNFWWFLAVPVIGYGVAWIGHAFIEHNQPATFANPFWSLRADFHMLWLWLSGRLEIELVRHGIST
jgi:hypothetical protein